MNDVKQVGSVFIKYHYNCHCYQRQQRSTHWSFTRSFCQQPSTSINNTKAMNNGRDGLTARALLPMHHSTTLQWIFQWTCSRMLIPTIQAVAVACSEFLQTKGSKFWTFNETLFVFEGIKYWSIHVFTFQSTYLVLIPMWNFQCFCLDTSFLSILPPKR